MGYVFKKNRVTKMERAHQNLDEINIDLIFILVG